MVRLFFLLFLLLGFNDAYAQPGFGPEIGVGMSSMHFAPELGFTSASTSPIFSGRVGAIGDFSLNKHVYLQPGIYLTRKGQSRDFSFKENDSLNEYVQQTLTINYIDVPLNLLYKTSIQGKGRVILGLGVTASYIISGTNKLTAQGASNGVPFTTDINSKIADGKPLAAFDLGVSLLAGYELPTGLFFRAYYVTGAKDIGLGTEIDKNRIWGISAGYIFGKGRNINKEASDLIDNTGK